MHTMGRAGNFNLNFGMMLKTYMKLCVTAGFPRKNVFAPKLGKWAKNKVF